MIKAGDLVVVTKPTPCCGNTSGIGGIFRVESIRNEFPICGHCWREIKDPLVIFSRTHGQTLSRLTRIDPLPESETHRDEVTA